MGNVKKVLNSNADYKTNIETFSMATFFQANELDFNTLFPTKKINIHQTASEYFPTVNLTITGQLPLASASLFFR